MAKARKASSKKVVSVNKSKGREIKLKLQEATKALAVVKKAAKAKEKQLIIDFKALAAKAADEAYNRGVVDAISELEKKAHAKMKLLASAEAKFEKKFASKLIKKAKSTKKGVKAVSAAKPAKSTKAKAPAKKAKAAKGKSVSAAKPAVAKVVKAKGPAKKASVKKPTAGRRGRPANSAQQASPENTAATA